VCKLKSEVERVVWERHPHFLDVQFACAQFNHHLLAVRFLQHLHPASIDGVPLSTGPGMKLKVELLQILGPANQNSSAQPRFSASSYSKDLALRCRHCLEKYEPASPINRIDSMERLSWPAKHILSLADKYSSSHSAPLRSRNPKLLRGSRQMELRRVTTEHLFAPSNTTTP